jgi:hypothetical protein
MPRMKAPPEYLTDDVDCPFCEEEFEEGELPEGAVKRYACPRHRWAYRVWFERYRDEMSQ